MDSKVCTTCGWERALEEFHRARGRPDGRAFECRGCRSDRDRLLLSTDHSRALHVSVRARVHNNGTECSIDLEWIRERLAGLDGRCELTGWRLDLGPRKPGRNAYAPSLDRIDNSKGYHPDNIRVVCAFVNFMMNEYTDEDMQPVILALRDAAYDQPPPLF